jgi:hypothetical protein
MADSGQLTSNPLVQTRRLPPGAGRKLDLILARIDPVSLP